MEVVLLLMTYLCKYAFHYCSMTTRINEIKTLVKNILCD